MRFKGKAIFMGAVIMSQMFSPAVLLVGIYRLMTDMNLTNSLLGLILLNAAFTQAFAIWLLRGTFTSNLLRDGTGPRPGTPPCGRPEHCHHLDLCVYQLLE